MTRGSERPGARRPASLAAVVLLAAAAVSSGPGTKSAARSALERRAAEDPNPQAALAALETLRLQDTAHVRELLRRRIDRARRSGDADGLRFLLDEDERFVGLTRGTALPSFLRRPPTPFDVSSGRRTIRVLAFGDFGDGSRAQRETAAAMAARAAAEPFDFGLTLGDNFYREGSTSPQDPRWKTWWEDLYGPLGIRFYPVLGNHDWKLADSPAAEILYRSPSWYLPSPYYTFTAGEAQFFALDTNEVSEAQLVWLTHAMEASAARWKIAYGHHPVHSAGHHGDTPELVARLLPVLRGRADLYLCGHDHDLQRLREDGGVHFLVAGGGGAGTRPLKADPRELFGHSGHGFLTLEIGPESVRASFVGSDGRELDRSEIRKSSPPSAERPPP